jgi:hypothetical protein
MAFDNPQWLCEMHYDQIYDILSQYKGPVDSRMLEEWIIAVSKTLCINRCSRFRTAFQRILRLEITGVLRDQIIDAPSETQENLQIFDRSVNSDYRSQPLSIVFAQLGRIDGPRVPSYFLYFFETQCLNGYEGWSTSIVDLCTAYENWRSLNRAPSIGKCQIGAAFTSLGVTKHITKSKTYYNVKLRTT